MNIDYNVKFREAANVGNTTQMIQLRKQHQIDINGFGAKSLQSAAHRAAANGHVAALRLLYNLGADFSLTDTNGKTAKMHAKTQEAHDFFALIEIAQQALAGQNDVFQISAHLKSLSSEQMTTFLAWRKIYETDTEKQRREKYSELYNTADTKVSSQTWEGLKGTCDRAHENLFYWININNILKNVKFNGQNLGACNEFSSANFVNLTKNMNVPFLVEQVALMHTFLPGHAFTLVNRNNSQDVTNLTSWNTALVVDTWMKQAFFFQFANQVPCDKTLQFASSYTINKGLDNVEIAYPQEFPNTGALYQRLLQQYQDQATQHYTNHALYNQAAAAATAGV